MADSSLLSISTDCFVVVPLLAAARALISCRPRTADKGGSADVDFDSRPRRRVRKVLPVVQKKVTLLLATPRGPFTESVQSKKRQKIRQRSKETKQQKRKYAQEKS
eukprot:TRINITY_DN31825_c0_g1_i2.p2 TRINITY_DN31825_c0_g1~~TRINITY_DN31825_c0_g1_i2.p2  ORF type:complete len:118 (-),score=4.44 TRINITY_DN31825_c0_g1_i2:28-345(-)